MLGRVCGQGRSAPSARNPLKGRTGPGRSAQPSGWSVRSPIYATKGT
jgi:hypothetical protein